MYEEYRSQKKGTQDITDEQNHTDMEELSTGSDNEQKKKQHNNWVKADWGIKYLREGLAPFVDEAIKEQHKHILSKFKGKTCNSCTLETLLPKHAACGSSGNCALNCDTCVCNEETSRDRALCSEGFCSVIYDDIIKLYHFRPSTPCWMNTDAQKWSNDPWSFAKCFISFSGYGNKSGPSKIDCTGLMHILINNRGLHRNIECKISRKGDDVFCRVRRMMKQIIKDPNHEMSDKDFENFINDMVKILQDGRKLIYREESKEAVRKLNELKVSDLELVHRSPARTNMNNRFNFEQDTDNLSLGDIADVNSRTPLMSQSSYSSRYETEFQHKCILGYGAFGTVFEAVHIVDSSSYAVKRITLDNRKSSKRKDEVSKEIQALAQLEHPHIVRYFHAWFEDPPAGWQEAKDEEIGLSNNSAQFSSTPQSSSGRNQIEEEHDSSKNIEKKTKQLCYIQMQLCKRNTLAHWLEENTLNRENEKVLTWFRQISSAVSYVHDRGYLHRDLKPSNIFFSFENEMKVGDFGLATALEEDQYTSYYSEKGSSLYMAPEVLNKSGKVKSAKVDIYSLGVILFEMLYAFRTQMERIHTLQDLRQLDFPENFGREMPEKKILVGKMLSVEADKRPTAKEVMKEIHFKKDDKCPRRSSI